MNKSEERFYNELGVLGEAELICKFYDNESHPLEIEWSKGIFHIGEVSVHPFEDEGTTFYYVEDGMGERIVADLCNYLDSVFGDVSDE